MARDHRHDNHCNDDHRNDVIQVTLTQNNGTNAVDPSQTRRDPTFIFWSDHLHHRHEDHDYEDYDYEDHHHHHEDDDHDEDNDKDNDIHGHDRENGDIYLHLVLIAQQIKTENNR